MSTTASSCTFTSHGIDEESNIDNDNDIDNTIINDNNNNNATTDQFLFGFGNNYFHALGGSQKITLDNDNDNDNDDDFPVTAHTFSSLPWNNNDNNGNDTVMGLSQVHCTTSSTFFLTKTGKVYHVGTLHGVVTPTPQLVTIPYPLPVAQLACGRHYCLALLQGGAAVLAWGAGHFGQLGLGPHRSVSDEPTMIPHLLPHAGNPVTSIAAGTWHAAAVTQEGKVLTWGSNRNFQCGMVSPSNLVYPHPVECPEAFSMIICGKAHTLGLTKEGKVYSWGASYACGHSSRKTMIAPPRLVEALSNVHIVQLAAGESHSLALTGGGRVFGWGSNIEGQLGLGIPAQLIPRPKLIADLDFVAIVASEEWAKRNPTPTELIYDASPPPLDRKNDSVEESASQILPRVPKVISIFASGSYSMAISSAGHVYGWGYNDTGVLGLRKPAQELPMMEYNAITTPTKGRQLEIQTFDSQHNVLLPRRLDALAHLNVQFVGVGPSHVYVCGTPRRTTKDVVGRTLYEMQETTTRRRASSPLIRPRLSQLMRRMSGKGERPTTKPTSRARKLLSNAFGGK